MLQARKAERVQNREAANGWSRGIHLAKIVAIKTPARRSQHMSSTLDTYFFVL